MVEVIKNIGCRFAGFFRSGRSVGAMFAIVALVGGYLFFNHANSYFSSSVLLGGLLAPFIFRKVDEDTSRRFLWVAIGLGGLLFFRRSSSLFYLFSVTSVLYILESRWGKLNNLPVFLLGLMSALVGYIAYVWSFPIRMQLSTWAAKSLTLIGMETVASGNVIIRDGYEFTVDPACMGLRMLVTSGILALLIMAYFEHKHRYVFSFWQTAGYLSVMLLLAIVANFTRLLCLVVFKIEPEHPLHAGVGLWSLLVYALIPFYLWLTFGKRWPKEERTSAKTVVKAHPGGLVLFNTYGILLLLMLVNGPKFLQAPEAGDERLAQIQLAGFESELLESGVLKLENEQALVYVKPPAGPTQSAHDPRICWEGTGYHFAHIQRQQIGEEWIYTARLEKNDDRLYTAWWFENGQERTIGEWTWRWNTLKSGRGFRLVNVTVGVEKDLEREVRKLQQFFICE